MNLRPLWIIFPCIVMLAVSTASADWLEVRRGANIKKDPNNGAQTVSHVESGERLPLLAQEQENGYYRVRLSDGRTGWIYRSLVARHKGEDSIPSAITTGAAGKLEVHLINVGQGDAIFIRCPEGNHEMLIDSGDSRYPNSGRDFKAMMHQLQSDDNTIEVVVATHPHADHIGNMAWVLETYPVDLYVDNGTDYDSTLCRKVERAVSKNGARYWSAQDDDVPEIDFCTRPDVDARVLRPAGFGKDKDPNNNSVVVRVDYGDTSMLFVGDCEDHEEALLLADEHTHGLLDCDFLKVGHHGSDTSSTDAFLDVVTPKVAATPGIDHDRLPHPDCGSVRESGVIWSRDR